MEARSKVATFLPYDTPVIAGGTRHADGAPEISWAVQPEANVSIARGQLAQGCHIFFYASAAKSRRPGKRTGRP